MDTGKDQSAAVLALAERVVEDIRLRRMMPGDRYLSGDEARRAFAVGKGVMNRALRLLSERNILVRRQKAGTFVGQGAPVRRPVKIRTICALLPADRKDVFDFPFDLMIKSLCAEIPGAGVQFCFLPAHDGVEYVRQLLDSLRSTGHVVGVVPISCTHEVNRYLAGAGVPVVAFSSFYSDGQSNPTVNLDLHEGGRLLTQYLVDRGHRRMALLNVAESQSGDNEFHDGVSEALTASRLPYNSMIHRVLPPDIELIRAETCGLLMSDDPPTAFMARSKSTAEIMASAASNLGLAVPDDVEIAFRDHTTTKVEQSPYPHVRPKMRFEEVAALIGRMLGQLSEGEPLEKRRILVPVELRQARPSGGSLHRKDVLSTTPLNRESIKPRKTVARVVS